MLLLWYLKFLSEVHLFVGNHKNLQPFAQRARLSQLTHILPLLSIFHLKLRMVSLSFLQFASENFNGNKLFWCFVYIHHIEQVQASEQSSL